MRTSFTNTLSQDPAILHHFCGSSAFSQCNILLQIGLPSCFVPDVRLPILHRQKKTLEIPVPTNQSLQKPNISFSGIRSSPRKDRLLNGKTWNGVNNLNAVQHSRGRIKLHRAVVLSKRTSPQTDQAEKLQSLQSQKWCIMGFSQIFYYKTITS